MPRPPRLARLLVIALAVAIPAVDAPGCGGRTACFTRGSATTCPSPETINTSIDNSPTTVCSGAISSVDGPGTLDGDLCCYPVSYTSSSDGVACNLGDTTFTGGGTFGGGGFSGSSSSGFAGGPTTACVSCNAALAGAPFNQVCAPAVLTTLRQCACASACTTACDPTVCFGNAPDDGCLACMQQSCAADLQACQSN